MNEAYFDQACYLVNHLRHEGFEILLDDEEGLIVNPMSSLKENMRTLLVDRLEEVILFLHCECAVDLFLARLITDVET